MLWFPGTIPAAIAAAKQRGAVFVVFVTGDDEQSTEMTTSWEDEKVTEAVADGFVAIKIDIQSEACLQFSQIFIFLGLVRYKDMMPIKSWKGKREDACEELLERNRVHNFFIGDNGIPLEVIAGSVSAEELITRINKVKQMHLLKNEALESPASCSSSVYNVTDDSGSQTSEPIEEQPERPRGFSASEINSVQTNELPEGNDRGAESQAADALTAKVERVTKKLEQRQEEKKKEEEKKEMNKEIERRKTGKDMLEYKRKQEEERTKRILEEKNREKAEDRAARERIKQQIALDRAERASRYAKAQEEAEAAKAAALQAQQAEMEAKKEALQMERSTIARIQFRLPDGSSITNNFPVDTRLEEARQFAAQTVGSTYGNFSLATMFPRREFTKDDYDKKLSDLELAPSASVVLLPAGKSATAAVQSSGGDFWKFLGTILYPLIAVWRFLSNFLFSNPPPSQSSERPHQQEHSNPPSGTTEPSRQVVRKRVLGKRGEEFKKEGKIYRLKTQDDGEDDNNTWNGNSTQQM